MMSADFFPEWSSPRPATRSQSRIVESMLPEITCGSSAWVWSETTVCVWPVSVTTLFFVRTSHTRAVASRPPVTR